MTLHNYNARVVGYRIAEGSRKICLGNFLCKFVGEEDVILFANCEIDTQN